MDFNDMESHHIMEIYYYLHIRREPAPEVLSACNQWEYTIPIDYEQIKDDVYALLHPAITPVADQLDAAESIAAVTDAAVAKPKRKRGTRGKGRPSKSRISDNTKNYYNKPEFWFAAEAEPEQASGSVDRDAPSGRPSKREVEPLSRDVEVPQKRQRQDEEVCQRAG
eukprot:jgi/Hompol1/4265/HPOL_007020-RA